MCCGFNLRNNFLRLFKTCIFFLWKNVFQLENLNLRFTESISKITVTSIFLKSAIPPPKPAFLSCDFHMLLGQFLLSI